MPVWGWHGGRWRAGRYWPRLALWWVGEGLSPACGVVGCWWGQQTAGDQAARAVWVGWPRAPRMSRRPMLATVAARKP